jgi:hypothetical protein
VALLYAQLIRRYWRGNGELATHSAINEVMERERGSTLVTCSTIQEVRGLCYILSCSGGKGGLVACSIDQEVRVALLHAQPFRR